MDENLDIVVTAKAEGEHAIRDVKDAMDDLRRSVEETAAVMAAMIPAMEAMTAAQQVASAATKDTSAAFGEGIPLIGQWVAAIASLPAQLAELGPVGIAISAAVVGIVAVLATFTAALAVVGAAITTLAATAAVGFAAVGTAVLLAGGPIALLGAGVVFLADRFAKLHDLADPLKELEDHIGAVADAWGEQAAPMAKQVIQTLDNMLPAVQSAGQQILFWFGQNLLAVLRTVSNLTHAMSDEFNRLWPVVAGFLNEAIKRAPEFEQFFKAALHGGTEALKGMLDNLLKFVDWFHGEWPKLEPIIRQVMDQAGRALQAFGREAERLVNWFVTHWPEIEETSKNLAPVLQAVGRAIEGVGRLLYWLAQQYNAAVYGLGQIGHAFDDLGSAIRGAQSALGGLLLTLSRIPAPGGLRSLLTEAGAVAIAQGGGEYLGTHQSGGVIPGPFGAPQLAIVHGGEQIIPAAAAYMGGGGGSTHNTYNISVTATSANPVDVGREIVRNIQEYERRGGKAWRT